MIQGSSVEKLEAIMATPKLNLKDITIEWYAEDENDMKKVRAICDKGCENAEKISIVNRYVNWQAMVSFHGSGAP